MSRASALALFVFFALALQVSTNIYLTTQFSEGSRLDLMGFVILMSTGFVILTTSMSALQFVKQRILAVIAFMLFFCISIELNGGYSVIAWTLSKYGVVTWLLAGFFLHAVLRLLSLEAKRSGTADKSTTKLKYSIPIIMMTWLLFVLQDYAVSPFKIDSYQFASSNLIILEMIGLLIYYNFSAGNLNPIFQWWLKFQLLIFYVISSYATYLVARMDSTGIVLFWFAFSFLILTEFFKTKNIIVILSVLLTFFLMIDWAYFLEGFDFFTETRFREIYAADTLLISSASNRLELIDSFFPQFAVNPLFGHMRAEVVAGFQLGEYVHSLPLSLLTHAGLIGFFLFWLIIYRILFFDARQFDEGDSLLFRKSRLLFIFVLAIGSFTTFFTWMPVWFLIGFHLIKPLDLSRQR